MWEVFHPELKRKDKASARHKSGAPQSRFVSRGEEEMGLGRTPTIRQLCLQLDDYKSDFFALPRGPPSGLGGAQDARE